MPPLTHYRTACRNTATDFGLLRSGTTMTSKTNGNGPNFYQHRTSPTFPCPLPTINSNQKDAQNHKRPPNRSTWLRPELSKRTLKETGPSLNTCRKHSLNIQDHDPKRPHSLPSKHKATGSDPEEEGLRHQNPQDSKDSLTTRQPGLAIANTLTNFSATP